MRTTLLALLALAVGCSPGTDQRTSQQRGTDGNAMGAPRGAGSDVVGSEGSEGKGTDGQEPKTEVAVSEDAKKILTKLRDIDNYEIALGQLAVDRGSSTVKQYGAKLVEDHKRIDEQLTTLAGDIGVELPTAGKLPLELQAKVDVIKMLSGEDFDRAFRDEMIKGHEGAVKELEDARAKVSEPQVVAFLVTTQPVLQQHLDDAKAIELPPGT